MGKYSDNDTSFNFHESKDSRDSAGTERQDRYDSFAGDKHDHTWSATPRSGDGPHREGWVGRGGGYNNSDSSSSDSGNSGSSGSGK